MHRSMKLRASVAVFPLCLCLAASTVAADSIRFRGADGSGVFEEKGLAKSWPKDGPKQLWWTGGLGESYASVTLAGGRLYTTGKTEERGTVYALDLGGKLLWKKQYGGEHSGNGYPGTRSTPTVDGGALYLLSSLGKAVALDTGSGAVLWELDLLETFGGSNIYFGVSESPLILGDKVIYTPGGPDAAVVALDKKTGKTVWKTKGLSESAAYCSPRLLEAGKHRQIVTFVAKSLVGIDPDSGEVLWRHPSEVSYDIHATSPVFDGNRIYVSHGYDQGGMLLELAEDGRSVNTKWVEEKLDVHHGGAVFVNGYIYGAASKKTWYALDGGTGEIAASIKRPGKGSVIYADGLLYGYVESGEVVLVNPDPADFRVISSFEVERGEGQHWSHPVISKGVLYIRHGETLTAYDVKGGA